MDSRPALAELRCWVSDSRRWEVLTPRADDIVVATPPKCGTTWIQGIVASLQWPDGDAPGLPTEVSRWIDSRRRPVHGVSQALEEAHWRRCIKTHSPLDCIPIFEDCKYIAVFRNPADALASWANHRRAFRQETLDQYNESAAADGVEEVHAWNGDMQVLLDEVIRMKASPWQHLPGWWHVSDDPNVLLVHYSDLLIDLDGEMRRTADFLGFETPSGLWSAVVDRCRFDNYKAAFTGAGAMQGLLDGGADTFFDRGGKRRGEVELSPDVVERCDNLGLAADVPDDARLWLLQGMHRSGVRPPGQG